MSFVYNNIKRLAKEARLPLKALAEKIEMTDAGFHQMVNNDSMKVSTLFKIAEVLNVDVQIIMMKDFASYSENETSVITLNDPGITQKSNVQLEIDYFANRVEQLKKELKLKDEIIEQQKAVLEKADIDNRDKVIK